MHAVIDKAVAAAEIGADPIAVLDDLERLARVIADYGQRLEIHDVAVAQLVEIFGGKVAVDAAADAITLGANLDCLGDLDPAVLPDRNVAVKVEKAFIRAGQ